MIGDTQILLVVEDRLAPERLDATVDLGLCR